MARKLLSMRPIKDILRLKHQHGLSVREVARSCGLPASTVGDCLQRATAAGLGWLLPTELSEEQLQAKLLGGAPVPVTSPPTKAVPKWPHLREKLRRKGVTLQLLWQEYRQTEPTGYAYASYKARHHIVTPINMAATGVNRTASTAADCCAPYGRTHPGRSSLSFSPSTCPSARRSWR